MTKRANIESTADAYLELLAARGVEYFFANSGTDFAPLIDAYAKRLAQGQPVPRPMTIPHEVPAVGMAHGYALLTGRPQVVMVHVIVGAGNAVGGIINASRSNVTILFSAGRNPLTPGVVRPGRDDPRVREVGLRASELHPARDRRRSRAGGLAGRAARSGLPHLAA